MITLTKSQVIAMQQLIEATGGTPGIRDEGLLESALAAPFAEFGGFEFYPLLEQKASRLGYGLTAKRPFVDGNKRIGAHAMLVFLALNGFSLSYSQQELVDAFTSVADGTMTLEALTG